MCWHKLLYSNVSLMQHCTELLKKKCVVTLLLDNIRSLWIGFLNRFNEPNCPKRTGLRKLIGLGIVGITCQICILLNGQTQGLPAGQIQRFPSRTQARASHSLHRFLSHSPSWHYHIQLYTWCKRKWDSSDQVTFFHCSIVQIWCSDALANKPAVAIYGPSLSKPKGCQRRTPKKSLVKSYYIF